MISYVVFSNYIFNVLPQVGTYVSHGSILWKMIRDSYWKAKIGRWQGGC